MKRGVHFRKLLHPPKIKMHPPEPKLHPLQRISIKITVLCQNSRNPFIFKGLREFFLSNPGIFPKKVQTNSGVFLGRRQGKHAALLFIVSQTIRMLQGKNDTLLNLYQRDIRCNTRCVIQQERAGAPFRGVPLFLCFC